MERRRRRRTGKGARWTAALSALALVPVLTLGAGCGRHAEITLPEGTGLLVRLEGPLSTAIHRSDETFGAALAEPVEMGDQIVLPQGTRVRGRLLDVHSSSSAEEDGAGLTLVVDAVLVDATEPSPVRTAPIQLVTEENPLSEHEDVVVGDLAGSTLEGQDRAVGSFITVAAPDGEIVLRAGQRLRFRLTEAATLEAPKGTARAGM
jgi:hypothetical protein